MDRAGLAGDDAMTAHVEVWRVMVATWIGLACWLALSIPACLLMGRVCGMHQRCRYVDDLTREYREEVDDG